MFGLSDGLCLASLLLSLPLRLGAAQKTHKRAEATSIETQTSKFVANRNPNFKPGPKLEYLFWSKKYVLETRLKPKINFLGTGPNLISKVSSFSTSSNSSLVLKYILVSEQLQRYFLQSFVYITSLYFQSPFIFQKLYSSSHRHRPGPLTIATRLHYHGVRAVTTSAPVTCRTLCNAATCASS